MPLFSSLEKVSFMIYRLIICNIILWRGCSRHYFEVARVVLILDGYIEHVAHVYRKIGLFWEKYPICDALDLIKCIKQIKYQRLLLTCALFSELPSNISTKAWSEFFLYVLCLIHWLHLNVPFLIDKVCFCWNNENELGEGFNCILDNTYLLRMI